MAQNPSGLIKVPWEGDTPPSEQEAEARLHQEGYESFRWHDVPGASYPKHRHTHDECLWILQGEITFTVDDREYRLKAGDRLYLPSLTPHTARVPSTTGVTYLVGQRRKSAAG
jgi:quercetin dioxygenase-like cupin family protein